MSFSHGTDFRPGDFSPFTRWEERSYPVRDHNRARRSGGRGGKGQAGIQAEKPLFTQVYDVDGEDRHYFRQTNGKIRLRCTGLFLLGPVAHGVGLLYTVPRALWLLVSTSRSLEQFGWNMLRVFLVPLSPLLLSLSAFYGILSPKNGRKGYATYERLFYGRSFLAGSFQPSPQRSPRGGRRRGVQSTIDAMDQRPKGVPETAQPLPGLAGNRANR